MEDDRNRRHVLGEPKDNPFVGQKTVSPFGGQRRGNPFLLREEPQL